MKSEKKNKINRFSYVAIVQLITNIWNLWSNSAGDSVCDGTRLDDVAGLQWLTTMQHPI